MRREIREFREQNTRLHNATREDLTDLQSQMNVLRSQVNDGFVEMRGKFDATAAGLQQITGMLNTLIPQEGDL
jgi:hypothetical protein